MEGKEHFSASKQRLQLLSGLEAATETRGTTFVMLESWARESSQAWDRKDSATIPQNMVPGQGPGEEVSPIFSPCPHPQVSPALESLLAKFSSRSHSPPASPSLPKTMIYGPKGEPKLCS